MLLLSGNGYTCEGCDRMYNSINFLQRHKRFCLTRTVNRTWDCKTCNKKFASLSYLKIHVCKHSGEKIYQNNRQVHQSGSPTKYSCTDTSETRYQCTKCNKSFNQLGHLTKHLRTHTGEKPYQCTQCNKAFNHLGSLTTHLRTHTCQVKSHISVHNVTRRLTILVI